MAAGSAGSQRRIVVNLWKEWSVCRLNYVATIVAGIGKNLSQAENQKPA